MISRSPRVRRRLLPIVLLLAVLVAGVVLVPRLVLDGGAVANPFTGRGLSPAPADDGEIPAGVRVSVFDVDRAAIANLDPDLLAAIQRAATDADAAEGIPFSVTSGWRSPEYQARLLSEAERLYASAEEARRWVATPETSLHVSGDAIDIAEFDAIYWLSLHGAAYGLCQIYANEMWHFELRPEAVTEGCPEQYLDPTHDPRMG